MPPQWTFAGSAADAATGVAAASRPAASAATSAPLVFVMERMLHDAELRAGSVARLGIGWKQTSQGEARHARARARGRCCVHRHGTRARPFDGLGVQQNSRARAG